MLNNLIAVVMTAYGHAPLLSFLTVSNYFQIISKQFVLTTRWNFVTCGIIIIFALTEEEHGFFLFSKKYFGA